MKSRLLPESSRMFLGIYISVPFCRSKCSFCNFASGVFSREKMNGYVQQLSKEMRQAEALVTTLGAIFDRKVDSIYFGGGTPTTLAPDQLREIFRTIQSEFEVQPSAEITVECAPGTLSPEILDTLLHGGTNRVSLGTQSFVDEEIRSVGRLHNAQQTLDDVARLREAGIGNINLDLIAGLPHQTRQSWRISLERLAESGVPHASVYLLEVDEDSRLGRELIAGGERYHAHHVPNSDLAADLYVEATEFLASAGIIQYEISNFARPGWESRHNLKYWTRQPYLGFGLDAHSMLQAARPRADFECVRFGNTDDLSEYMAGSSRREAANVSTQQSNEESLFLGLRLNRGVDATTMNRTALSNFESEIHELAALGLLEHEGNCLRLTARGRLLSNEVFERFIATDGVALHSI